MFSDNGRISLRQGFRLYLFDFVGIASLVVLPYLARTVGTGGVFSILLGVVWGLIYLLFLYEIHGKMETDLGTFLTEFVPVGVRVAVQMWLIAHCVAVAGFAAYLFGMLMQYSLLDGERFPVILVVILAVAAYAISGGMESRARVYEVLFWFVLVPLIVMLVAAGTQMESVYFEEIMDVGFLDMLYGSYLVFLFFATAFWTLFFTKYLTRQDAQQSSAVEKQNLQRSEQGGAEKQNLQRSGQGGAGNVRARKKRSLQADSSKLRNTILIRKESIENANRELLYEYSSFFKRVALAMVLSGVLLAVAYLVCLGNFGGAALAEMDFPIITLMSSIRIPGNFVKRLDALMIAVWFFMLFAFLNLHLFYGVRVMQDLVGEPMRNRNGRGYRSYEEEKRTNEEDSAGRMIVITVVFSGVMALLYYYNSAAASIFFGYIYYVGTPLLVVAPLMIYWFGRGRRT